MTKKVEKPIKLTSVEKQAISAQREMEDNRAEFVVNYEVLAKEYGFAIAVDMNAPLNKPRVTVVQLR